MKKRVFTGIINGETFNNVKDYNEKMTELLKQGVNINASSSTTVEDVEDNKLWMSDVKSLLPYFNTGDKYYLDSLISAEDNIKTETNKQKVLKTFVTSFDNIKNYLSSKDISNSEKMKYVDNVLDIINKIKQDDKLNKEAWNKLEVSRKDCIKSFEEITAAHNKEIESIDSQINMLKYADEYIKMFKAFYNDVMQEASNKVNFNENKCSCGSNCTCTGSCETPKTTIKETVKPKVKDLTELFNRIFGTSLDDIKNL